MRRILILVTVTAILAAGCAAVGTPPGDSGAGAAPSSTIATVPTGGGPTTSVTVTVAATTEPPDGSTEPPAGDSRFVVETDGERTIVRIPALAALDCADVTASPVLVDGLVVYPLHVHGRTCGGGDWGLLLGYDPDSGTVTVLSDAGPAEATPVYDAVTGLLYLDLVGARTSVAVLDASTFTPVGTASLRAGSDSAGVVLGDAYYTGTVNTPEPACQAGPNPDCGVVVALSTDGTVTHRLDVTDGFRNWVAASITTDGKVLYVGGGPHAYGADLTTPRYGCAVTMLDPSLQVVSSFDPGDPGCHRLGFHGADEDAVAGEVVPTGDGVWVAYARPNADESVTRLYRLGEDLTPVCSVGFPSLPRYQTVGFYDAVTVDAAGNAYLAITTVGTSGGPAAELWRVSPGCDETLLTRIEGRRAGASPTLADDGYVLFATDGLLTIVTYDGDVVARYELGSDAGVSGSPMIAGGVVYVVQRDGTLTAIAGTGLEGYGNAVWPRYRHDNAGSADLTTPTG